MTKHTGHTWEEFVTEHMSDEQKREMKKENEIISLLVGIREKLRLSQKDVADISGIKQPVIARIESGKVNVGVKTLQRILKPLGYKLTIVKEETTR